MNNPGDRNFTSQENTRIARDSLRLLGRFVSGLHFLKPFIPFSLALVIISTVMPILFLWAIAQMADCGNLSGCPAVVPYLGISVTLNSWFLVYLVLGATFLRTVGWILFEVPGQLATRPFHRQMVQGLGNTRTTYFDENPSGRLLNRLVGDYNKVRQDAIVRLGDSLNCVVELISIASVTLFAHYLVGLLIIPLLIWIVYAQWFVSMMLQRLGIIRSSRFGEVLHRETDVIEGARTFLIYERIPALFSRVRSSMQRFVQAHLTHMRIEGLGFLWTGFASSLFIAVSILVVGYQTSHNLLSAVIAGTILTALTRLAPMVGWTSWIFAYLLESVGQIRRVFEVIDLPHEEREERAEPAVKPVSQGELLHGDLIFKDYSMSYRANTPTILNQLSLRIPAGKQIGIIGRTGAGKTSLMQSLFRMVYVQAGDILIGDQSILACPVEFARRHFAVVPQDPYLFAGTICSNLDPYGEYNDERVQQVLTQVGLSISINDRLQEGGENFSRGERQLLCLARVLLGNHPFILMDEPTSGVDTITDARIQDVLANLLRGRTVITIAHRLNTIAKYDWAIELEDGKLKAEGTPAQVIGNRIELQ